jgi:hypothetical protein
MAKVCQANGRPLAALFTQALQPDVPAADLAKIGGTNKKNMPTPTGVSMSHFFTEILSRASENRALICYDTILGSSPVQSAAPAADRSTARDLDAHRSIEPELSPAVDSRRASVVQERPAPAQTAVMAADLNLPSDRFHFGSAATRAIRFCTMAAWSVALLFHRALPMVKVALARGIRLKATRPSRAAELPARSYRRAAVFLVTLSNRPVRRAHPVSAEHRSSRQVASALRQAHSAAVLYDLLVPAGATQREPPLAATGAKSARASLLRSAP